MQACLRMVKENGGVLVETYRDEALSGASLLTRPGVRQLLEDARAGRFDRVLAEALDRLSRDQEDTAAIFKRMAHADIAIETLAEGVISELHVGLKGTMNALFLKDLALKVRRGLRAAVESGRSAGGLPYGYRVVRELRDDGELRRGLRAIDDEQAAVVRRIFADYAAGQGVRQIAIALNREGVAPPRGARWNASTIAGNAARTNGILHNEAYRGRLVFNRQRFVKDPETGKRVPRVNPRAQWLTVEAPGLRIVDEDLWARVGAMRSYRAPLKPHEQRRPKHLLSGLVRCGVCGGPYTMQGMGRMKCAAHREAGTCANNRSIAAAALEDRVLAGLKQRLLGADAVEAFIKEYRAAMKRRAAAQGAGRRGLEKEMAEILGAIERIVTAIERGVETPAMLQRIRALETRRQALEAELATAPAPRAALDLHPQLGALYRRKLDDLRAALTRDPAVRDQAGALLRLLVERVVVMPAVDSREVEVELHGRMAAILDHLTPENVRRTKRAVTVVAGGRSEHYPHPTAVVLRI